jgi:hypothetical protein
VALTANLLLTPRLRMGGFIFLLPLYAFIAWIGVQLPFNNFKNIDLSGTIKNAEEQFRGT